MADRQQAIKGLTEISEYARAKADIAGIGKGKEVFDSWYRAVEDAIAFLWEQECLKEKCLICPHCRNCDVDEDGLLKEQPEIVRCKDCKHYDHDTQSCNDGLDGIFLPDWFCADGERR